MSNIFSRTFKGLARTSQRLTGLFDSLQKHTTLTEDDIDALEAALLTADIGWELTDAIIAKVSRQKLADGETWRSNVVDILAGYMNGLGDDEPSLKKIVVVVGVNGTGKTTTVAKLATYFKSMGEKVLLVAADTYRAAAVEQLHKWADRLQIDIFSDANTTDQAAIAYAGVDMGLTQSYDRIIIDTAGRIHTAENLMRELGKIQRAVSKLTEEATTLLVLDSTVGQTGIQQYRQFADVVSLDGFVLAKIDGTAKGGIAIPLMLESKLPVYFLGIGEQPDDLVPFNMRHYLESLVSAK